MNFRTDLAIELAQQLQDTVSQDYQTVQKAVSYTHLCSQDRG